MAGEWHVIGVGAMGGLFATRLARQGVPMVLLPHHPPASTGPVTLTVDGLGDGRQYTLPWQAIDHPSAIRHLLVTTKAHDVVPALLSVAPRLAAGAEVVILANGMGFDDELARRLPALTPCLGTTTEGAYRKGPWHLHHAGRGATRLGRRNGAAAPAWFSDWRAALPDCHWETDIGRALWRKLAINCAINPLTALHRCRNGQLAREARLADEVQALCGEIQQVGEAAGQDEAVRELAATVFEVILATAENRSSMLQDVEAGRRTEIDYITGYLVAAGERAGVATPLNSALLDAVRAQTEQTPQHA